MTNLNKVLKERFGFNEFKPGQAAILEALIAGQNVVGILPTGGGKSLIYQMMGSLRPGVVLIVSPLLSLMQDQVGRLNFLGEAKAIALNSTLDQQTRTDVLRHLGDFHYIFVSPEMLTNPSIQRALRQVQINLMVVDEAHTIVSWGPDFRPEYLQLAAIHAQLNRPQLLLLTATATQKMLASMLTVMQLVVQHTKIVRLSVNRENI
ncbi:DEAD/DEAH box helicase [Weissella soli]|uniref:DEAD/DEAH box helicase n=1 Tax=Weissella soli TaxID=155866 RepID=UPI00359FBDBA